MIELKNNRIGLTTGARIELQVVPQILQISLSKRSRLHRFNSFPLVSGPSFLIVFFVAWSAPCRSFSFRLVCPTEIFPEGRPFHIECKFYTCTYLVWESRVFPKMVRVAGYDPATSCFPSKCATRLRHTLSLWVQSGRKDLNPRPLVTETSALPDCATPRLNPHRLLWPPAADGSYPDTDYYPCQTLFLRTYGAPATRRV